MNSADLLPPAVEQSLLERWREPHRRYHSLGHLEAGLEVLGRLEAGRLERIAFWFHDAVHANSSPTDERASAALAAELLRGHLPPGEILEVCRLVMVTVDHLPGPDDHAGARIADADLAGLGASWPAYAATVAMIRAECPRLTGEQWTERRLHFVTRMLSRPAVFGTRLGLALWERQAQENLRREADQLSASSW